MTHSWSIIMPRVTENDVALAVLAIASKQKNLLCTLNRARNEVPSYVNLSKDDLEMSQTRPNEPMWHQLIRNIQSHHETDGNFINDGLLIHIPRKGYQATPAGLTHLKKLGF